MRVASTSIPHAEISRTLSPPIPTRQVDGVGRLVPRDHVARPAGVSGCHPRTRTGSARFRAQVTELAPPVPKTEGIIGDAGRGRISFVERGAFPLPGERVRVRGKSRYFAENPPHPPLRGTFSQGRRKGAGAGDKLPESANSLPPYHRHPRSRWSRDPRDDETFGVGAKAFRAWPVTDSVLPGEDLTASGAAP